MTAEAWIYRVGFSSVFTKFTQRHCLKIRWKFTQRHCLEIRSKCTQRHCLKIRSKCTQRHCLKIRSKWWRRRLTFAIYMCAMISSALSKPLEYIYIYIHIAQQSTMYGNMFFFSFAKFLVLWALKYTLIMGLTDIDWQKKRPKPVPLKFCSCTLCESMLSEVLLGLLFNALKRQKVANFPRAEQKPLDLEFLYWTQRIPFSLVKKHFL